MAPSRRKQAAAGKSDLSRSASSAGHGSSRKGVETFPSGNSFTRGWPLLLLLAGGAACITYFALRHGLVSQLPLVPGGTTSKVDARVREHSFEVRDLPGRGKGLIATRDIRRGELLIKEEPLILVPSQISTSPQALINERLAGLAPAQRSAFLELSYADVNLPASLPPDEREQTLPLAIFQTNAVSAEARGVGLFPKMARLNHGCARAFNVVYSWREGEGVLVVHALRDIAAGEELLTTYTDTKRSRAERQDFLLPHYGFKCDCAVCSLNPEASRASDLRLQGMSHGHARLKGWSRGEMGGPEAIKLVKEIWTLGTAEGYHSERGVLCADAAWVAAAHLDADAVRGWAGLAARWYGYELGPDADKVREMDHVRREPTRHAAWGTREAVEVGGPETDMLRA